ncbi:MAG: flavodoxin family protein [Desulfovibrionaceae bacterium]
MTQGAVVFACSPRKGGNTDVAAALLAQGVQEAGGRADVVYLRDHAVAGCMACGHCERDPACGCALAATDQAESLFALLLATPCAIFASPIYFYSVPAHFKAFIDRAQRYYVLKRRPESTMACLPWRKAHVVLAAGRVRGDYLFDGALRTLRVFLDPFNLTLDAPLLLRGLDAHGELATDATRRDQLRAHGRAAWTGRSGLDQA